MNSATLIASLVGPVLPAVTVPEARNRQIWTGVPPAMTFLNG